VQNYTLVEYRDDTGVDSILSNCRQFPDTDNVPVQSRMLYYQARRERWSAAGHRNSYQVQHRKFFDNYRLNVLTELALQKCPTVSDLSFNC